jgi:hypothetical protein
MQLNDLLRRSGIDPKDVIVFRHAPTRLPKLREDFPRLIEHNHDLFNAYQQTQDEVVESALKDAKFVASFIGQEPGKAVFVGLYSRGDTTPLSFKEYWSEPLLVELTKKYGMKGMTYKQGTTLWFDLVPLPFCKERKGKMIIKWPGKERSWWRWAHRNEFLILEDGLPPQLGVIQDIEDVQRRPIPPTTKAALVNARVGQGAFREQVLELWGQCCAVTGSVTLNAIRASHIRPWRHSTDKERLDPYNGLPLLASLDALFDTGLISFASSGRLLVSGKLSATEKSIFGLHDKSSLKTKPTAKTDRYLDYHRKHVYCK